MLRRVRVIIVLLLQLRRRAGIINVTILLRTNVCCCYYYSTQYAYTDRSYLYTRVITDIYISRVFRVSDDFLNPPGPTGLPGEGEGHTCAHALYYAHSLQGSIASSMSARCCASETTINQRRASLYIISFSIIYDPAACVFPRLYYTSCPCRNVRARAFRRGRS